MPSGNTFLEAFFSGAITLYRYGFCGIPTGNCRRNRYILQQSSAYGADIITPHLPQAASSPQAPQGEDKWGAPQKLNTVLTYGGSFPVSSVTSTPGSRNMRIGSCVKAPLKKRGSYGLFHYLEPGYRNNRIRSGPNAPLKIKTGTVDTVPVF